MSQSFVEVQIKADEELAGQLIAILSQLGFEGFWEDGSLLKCYIGGSRWNPAMRSEVETVVQRMTRSSSSASAQVAVNTIENENWNEKWERTIKPIQITESIVIKPTWHAYLPAPGQFVITIDPKMSFGTGYHETTRLVLRLMEKHMRQGMTVLDVGTGTGVLAIAGVLLGASSAIGVDIDEWSYENALENIRLNHVDGKVEIIHGELASVPQRQFDLIVANIQLNVIVPLLPGIRQRLSAGGRAIFSGLFVSDREEIVKELSAAGFAVCEEMTENEWIAVAAR